MILLHTMAFRGIIAQNKPPKCFALLWEYVSQIWSMKEEREKNKSTNPVMLVDKNEFKIRFHRQETTTATIKPVT